MAEEARSSDGLAMIFEMGAERKTQTQSLAADAFDLPAALAARERRAAGGRARKALPDEIRVDLTATASETLPERPEAPSAD